MKRIGTVSAGGNFTFTVERNHTYILQIGLPYNDSNYFGILCVQYSGIEIIELRNKNSQYSVIKETGLNIKISKNNVTDYTVGVNILDITVAV